MQPHATTCMVITQIDLRWGTHCFARQDFHCLSGCLNAATDRSLPRRHRSTSLHLLEQRCSRHHTPCGARAHNLRIRCPTPCPLGQGLLLCQQEALHPMQLVAYHFCNRASCGKRGTACGPSRQFSIAAQGGLVAACAEDGVDCQLA